MNQTHGQPADISVEQGMVLIDGPRGLALTMTPDAAEETGRRLIQAAAAARASGAGQELNDKR